jgi:hypothetical protein
MNTNQAPKRRARRGLAVLAITVASALAVPASGWADSMTLAVPSTPVQEIGGQVSWSAVSEEPALAVVAANNPGVPCASTPAADQGTTLTPGHLLEGGNVGDWSGSAGFTPPTPGAYILCGWLEEPAGLIETDGGPITTSTSLQVQVRAPVISLKLSLPRPAQPGRPFVLNLTATSEVQRHVVVEGVTAPRRGCPINYAVENDQHLIDQDITGGPWRLASNIEPLRRGTYIFCAWADPAEDSGLDPQAATWLTVHVGTQAPASRPRKRYRHLLAERPATRTEFAAIDRYFAATERSLYVRLDWVRVSTRAPYALAYLSGAEQISVDVLRGAGTSWRNLATISDEGLRCGLVPPSVVAGLHLERYN